MAKHLTTRYAEIGCRIPREYFWVIGWGLDPRPLNDVWRFQVAAKTFLLIDLYQKAPTGWAIDARQFAY
jgi:hypothetical protein